MDSMNNSIDAAEQQRRQNLPITAYVTDGDSFFKNPPADRMNQWLKNNKNASFAALQAQSFNNEAKYGSQFPKKMMLAYQKQENEQAQKVSA